MLKQYIWQGTQWQFEEKEAPEGAVELTEKPVVKEKAVTPQNKAKETKKK